jgi:hypothetical protein
MTRIHPVMWNGTETIAPHRHRGSSSCNPVGWRFGWLRRRHACSLRCVLPTTSDACTSVEGGVERLTLFKFDRTLRNLQYHFPPRRTANYGEAVKLVVLQTSVAWAR